MRIKPLKLPAAGFRIAPTAFDASRVSITRGRSLAATRSAACGGEQSILAIVTVGPCPPSHVGPYWFFFFANEGLEAPHVHVQRDRCLAKFWLRPVALASTSGFAGRELGRLHRLVEGHRDQFEEAWYEFFAPQR